MDSYDEIGAILETDIGMEKDGFEQSITFEGQELAVGFVFSSAVTTSAHIVRGINDDMAQHGVKYIVQSTAMSGKVRSAWCIWLP